MHDTPFTAQTPSKTDLNISNKASSLSSEAVIGRISYIFFLLAPGQTKEPITMTNFGAYTEY